MKFVQLKSGDVIIVCHEQLKRKKVIAIHGRNINSPSLKMATYSANRICPHTIVHAETVINLLSQKIRENFYIGEHIASKETTPAQVTKTLKGLCETLQIPYVACDPKAAQQELARRKLHTQLRRRKLLQA